MVSDVANTILHKTIFKLRSRLKKEQSKAWKQTAVVFLRKHELGSVAQRDKIPERCHLWQVVLEKLLMQLSQQSDELLVNMLNSSSMEKHKVKYLGPFADIFFPLGKLAARTLRLGVQVLE